MRFCFRLDAVVFERAHETPAVDEKRECLLQVQLAGRRLDP
jgi:hypothetical protein